MLDGVNGPELGVQPLDEVRYFFEDLDGPKLEWWVRRLHWSEELSRGYEFTVEILTEDLDVDCDELLGARCALEVERGELLRCAYGVIHRLEYLGVVSDKQMVRVHAVPAFHLLSQQVDTRVFQGMTVIEVLEEVLQPALAAYDCELDTISRVKSSYNKRDYCVQYNESTLDFARRLMEGEGIAHCFEPDESSQREKLVLYDNNNDYGDVLLVQGTEVPIITRQAELADRESLRFVHWSLSEQVNRVESIGFNWKIPSAPDEALQIRDDAHHPRKRELYLHDDRRQIVDDVDDESITGENLEQRTPTAKRRLELFTAKTQVAQGRGNVTHFMPGLEFVLADHEVAELSGKSLLLTRVLHVGEAPEVIRGEEAGVAPRYSNSFECIPATNPFRPALATPRPRVLGPETATVVGPEHEEIFTDAHGRIKVQFHWDRLQPADGTSSCWVRVAQAWAGPGWGSLFIPRIGMEVIVEFLEGNPDRPLVTGCVYNGENQPPYSLPDDKTKSTIKTNSTVGGEGFNEFRFEDLKGEEEVFLHAQKDFNEVVANDHSTTVHANQTNTVDGNQTQSIGGNQTESVTGEQTMTVEKNRTVTIEGSQAVTINGAEANSGVSGSKLGITGDYIVDASNTIEVQAPTHIKLTCGSSSILIEPDKISIEAGGKAKVVFDTSAIMESSDGSQVKLDADATTCSSGGSVIKLDADVGAQSSGGAQVKLDANASISGAETVAASTNGGCLTLTANAELVGADTSIQGSTKVGIAGGAINSSASGSHEITGSVVKIN